MPSMHQQASASSPERLRRPSRLRVTKLEGVVLNSMQGSISSPVAHGYCEVFVQVRNYVTSIPNE